MKPLKFEQNLSGNGINFATLAFPIGSKFLMSGIFS